MLLPNPFQNFCVTSIYFCLLSRQIYEQCNIEENTTTVQYIGFLKCHLSRIKRIKFFYRHNEKVLRKLSSNICTENKAYIKRLKNINRRRIKEKHEIRVQNSLSFSNLLGLIYNQEGRSPKENLLTAVHLR